MTNFVKEKFACVDSLSFSQYLETSGFYGLFSSFLCFKLKISRFLSSSKWSSLCGRFYSRTSCFVAFFSFSFLQLKKLLSSNLFAAQIFLKLEIQLQQQRKKVSASCQLPQNQWLCKSTAFNLSRFWRRKIFLENMLFSLISKKLCLRNLKSAWQAVRCSIRSHLSRGFDFSAPRRLSRVLPSHRVERPFDFSKKPQEDRIPHQSFTETFKAGYFKDF